MTGPLDAEVIRRSLSPRCVGRTVVYLAECDSTNSEVLRRVSADPAGALGLVVIADHQTAGRGRLGRRWHAPRGASLLMTVVVAGDASVASRVVLGTGIAIREAVHETCGADAELAWPNDVYVRGRKLAGVLVETARTAGGESMLAVGIGVNCLQHAGHFPAEIRERATSLEIESYAAVSRQEFAIGLLKRLDERLAEALGARDEALSQRWREHSGDVGRRAELVHGGRRYAGTVVEIDASHGLWMQLDGGGRLRFDPLTTSKAG